MPRHSIPSGYQMHIETWENDGDSTHTKIVSGLDEADIKFIITLLKNFQSNGYHRAGEYYGNEGVEGAVLVSLVEEAMKGHPNISRKLHSDLVEAIKHDREDDEESWVYQLLCDNYLNYPDSEFYSYEYTNFCRVVDNIKVFMVPTESVDVTANFELLNREELFRKN
jgi:hypothetical protein